MTDATVVAVNGPLAPARTPEERDERLIDQAFGNIHIEHPEITRGQVADVLRLEQIVKVSHVAKR